MITVGIETSCDETAAAVVSDGKVLSSEVSSSVDLHSSYGGVVPEIASRFHSEYILQVFRKALDKADIGAGDIDLVSVTQGPGLPGSLLVGISFAKALSYSSGAEILGIDHVHAHLFSGFTDGMPPEDEPFTGMVVSGGHTSLFLCRSVEDIRETGRTRDDAVGEAYDKVAKILGLGYPGGPVVERMAGKSDGKDRIGFPRPLLGRDSGLDFSFSGIKTAVLYYWRDCPRSEKDLIDICFSFQEAVLDVIIEKLKRAVRSSGTGNIVIGGGVVNNGPLRRKLRAFCEAEGINLFMPDKQYCTDNAAMVALLGERLYRKGERSDLAINAEPSGLTGGRR
ncbi:MAG: tRNA (adenosine(37)-N6)-threonylcarbamoyltransferase complex transferase subunit TsaD [Candidatus Omnitrophica bacterium]|nr:tRNA (adenosine(37)-N6)-threonylcarbamoyltransferase complex transferase subunit TsaD [Candidatus Omnitrophota bacterium]